MVVAPGVVVIGVVAPGVVAPGAVVIGFVAPGVIAPGVIAPGVIAPGAVAKGIVAPGVVAVEVVVVNVVVAHVIAVLFPVPLLIKFHLGFKVLVVLVPILISHVLPVFFSVVCVFAHGAIVTACVGVTHRVVKLGKPVQMRVKVVLFLLGQLPNFFPCEVAPLGAVERLRTVVALVVLILFSEGHFVDIEVLGVILVHAIYVFTLLFVFLTIAIDMRVNFVLLLIGQLPNFSPGEVAPLGAVHGLEVEVWIGLCVALPIVILFLQDLL